MSSILIKIFATALTLGQVAVHPEDVKTVFDPQQDRPAVVQILKDGCAHMRRAFDVEDINLDELITTAMDDPQAIAGDMKVLQGISFGALHTAYRQYCKNENVEGAPADLGEVIAYYNAAMVDLPDHNKLKGLKLPGMSIVLDGKGERFAEVYDPDHRRVWVPLSHVPDHVQKAFVAAEDKRFYQHKGIDERGIIRAFIGNLAQPGRPQGGSTITQQVIKNLLVGDDVTYERKMREMVVAARVERTLSKPEILEIYLNSIYLGRASWGLEMAARSYFGKSVTSLTVQEGALLAGLPKGPNYYNPDRHPDRARERLAYVLTRMEEDGAIGPEQAKQALADMPRLVAMERTRRDTGFHFIDHLNRDAKALAGIEGLTTRSYTVRTTINPSLQRATEAALQNGLARYELSVGRQRFSGAEANLTDAIRTLDGSTKTSDAAPDQPSWRRALAAARLPLYDVHWPAAVVVEKGRDRKSGAEVLRVGLDDGRILPLTTWSTADRRSLKLHDVVRVRLVEAKGKPVRAELRVPPSVQGAALVMDNKTGRILAMAGGFSYPLSQLNRTTQAHRQPGSALKPLTYLAALAGGLQPNTLVWDTPVTLPPVGDSAQARLSDYWTPKNYDGGSAGIMTLRRALENSKNLVTARLLDGGIAGTAERSLRQVCDLALEAQLYLECVPHYPFVLGAQPLRLIDLAAFYAAVANEGARPSPYAIESIEEGGRAVYQRKPMSPIALGSADKAAFFQLKTILQGVLERGTARSIRQLAPYVAGKTGTTDNENDAWFVSFTNAVTVAVWAGYDNADGKRRTLGRGQTGAKIAIPIAQPILEAAWVHHAPKTAMSPPSKEAAQQLVALPVDPNTGDRVTDGRASFTEYFRLTRSGQLTDTQFRLVPEQDAYAFRNPDPWADGEGGGWAETPTDIGPYGRPPEWFEAPHAQVPDLQSPWYEEERPRRRSRRVDPDYPWTGGPIY
jgi:membrane carboxypeptidase/penicillin-binding protein